VTGKKVNNNGNGMMDNDLDNGGDGATGDVIDHDGHGATHDNIDDNCDGATGDKVDDDADGAKLLSPSKRRRLCHCHCVVALIVMVLLSSPMLRHLVIVYDDGDGVTGNDDDDNFNNALDFAVVTMVLLPSLQWRHYHHRCTGVLPLSMMMVMARCATKSMIMTTAQWATTSMMMAKA
jgi:hypothetical protein